MTLTLPQKPPYRVPAMAEIAELPDNGLRVVSTFTGAGGSCLGFRMAGYRTAWASEFVEAARDTYAANFPDVPLDPRDVREVTGDAVRAATGLTEFDVLEGSPPCASFSLAGKREAGWGQEHAYSDTTQRVDDLFAEYVRLLRELHPRCFVAENVRGLVIGKAKGVFRETLAELRAAGYRTRAAILDAQWLGVPQRRQRVIFCGVRDDLELDPVFPDPLPYRYSMRDALPWLGAYRYDAKGNRGAYDLDPATDPVPVIAVSGGAAHLHHHVADDARVVGGPGSPFANKGREFPLDEPVGAINTPAHHYYVETQKVLGRDEVAENVAPSLDGYALGEEWDRLGVGESSDKYLNLIRPDPDEPSPTVTAVQATVPPGGVATVAHPTERRKFTIGELKRLCGFPDDFVLVGTFGQRWERLGRAVPPPMMRAVAETLRDRILAPCAG